MSVAGCQLSVVGRGRLSGVTAEYSESIQKISLAVRSKCHDPNTLRGGPESIRNTGVGVQSNYFGPNTLQFRLRKLLWVKILFFIFSMRVS